MITPKRTFRACKGHKTLKLENILYELSDAIAMIARLVIVVASLFWQYEVPYSFTVNLLASLVLVASAKRRGYGTFLVFNLGWVIICLIKLFS